ELLSPITFIGNNRVTCHLKPKAASIGHEQSDERRRSLVGSAAPHPFPRPQRGRLRPTDRPDRLFGETGLGARPRTSFARARPGRYTAPFLHTGGHQP